MRANGVHAVAASISQVSVHRSFSAPGPDGGSSPVLNVKLRFHQLTKVNIRTAKSIVAMKAVFGFATAHLTHGTIFAETFELGTPALTSEAGSRSAIRNLAK